jgi:hypothetical protein
MRNLLLLVAVYAAGVSGGTLFLPAYPNALLVVDEGKGQIVDRIPLTTGTPRAIRLSPDHKKIYVSTIDRNGIEIVDIATRKVINHFVLNTATKQYRFRSGAPDPDGKLFYCVTKEIDKLPEHYEVNKAKYTVIDLEQQKIVRTADIAPEDQFSAEAGFGRSAMEVSPDGKYLYQFGQTINILRTEDFKVVDRLQLARPDLFDQENIHFGADLDLIGEPGQHISIFNSADPIVHNKVFGIARFDLSTRQMNFNPIGPAPSNMAGMQVTPDKRFAFTVVANGKLGNKRCEFWGIDLSNDQLTRREELPCRSRFSFGMSSDGKKLYIYGAGFEIDVYDALTLKHERTWDLKTDITSGGIVVVP